MSLAFTLPRAHRYASDDLAREILGRISRALLLVLGFLLVGLGFVLAPLPGPMGLPLTVVGLMLILRNSVKARRGFVKLQQAHPRMLFPIRRLLRREPEVLLVGWQQVLRIERLLLPSRFRVCVRTRRSFRRRPYAAGSGVALAPMAAE